MLLWVVLLILSPRLTTLLNRMKLEFKRSLVGFSILSISTFVWTNLFGFELCHRKSNLHRSFLFSLTGPKHYKSTASIPLSGDICLCAMLTGTLVCDQKALSPDIQPDGLEMLA